MELLPLLIIVGSIAVIVLVMAWYFKQYFGALTGGGSGAGGTGGLRGLIGMMSSLTAGVPNGVPATAVIESIAETGMTLTTPSVGPEAAVFKLGLQVTPAGGVPYNAEISQVVPRIYRPMIVPGAQVGVLVDPANPSKVVLDWSRIGAAAGAAGAFGGAEGTGANSAAGFVPVGPTTLMTQGGTMNTAGVNVTFDAQGNPTSGLDAMVNAVQAGTMPQIPGSAAALLATGTHGTAVITSCQPLGKKVRDVNPRAEASHLDDPMWLFTVEVTVAGRPPFASMFGHRVPMAKVGYVAPGVKLAVAVDESNPSQDVAIDWDNSPVE